MQQILDPRIQRELLELKQSMEIERKLFTNQELETYYDMFRSRFGPDKLSNLDGVALLETMHSHGSKDSLVYWLEFKNDNEFPSPEFGSIAGGSAFKFGLFRKAETGIWTTGAPTHPIELSVEQAIEKARQHRDQLLAGCRLLENLPDNGTDRNYEQLQQDMNSIAPDVSNSAWGHKYFSLLYPDKLDDFHNPDYQRFHLIRLLQLPPHDKGRYIAAGRYVAMANVLELPMNTLTTLLNERDGSNPYNYWRIGPSENEKGGREYWPYMQKGNYCAIRWPEAGNLGNITNDTHGQDRIRQIMQLHYSNVASQAIDTIVQQIFRFIWKINVGDVVLAAAGDTVIGIGKVTGKYRYDPTDNFPHRRDVEWLSFDEWNLLESDANRTTYQIRKEINRLEVEKHILDVKIPKGPDITVIEPVFSRLTGIPARIEAVLERKGQVILYGPPGTGKTYWAELTVRELAARASFRKSFDQLTSEQRITLLGNGRVSTARVRICSFHPAYGYEDFLEGFRPDAENGHMQFVLRNGIFKQLCQDAILFPGEKFYLVIDEINRGDIPRIFGELLTVLEKDKRGKSILLPLTNKSFHVPDNVYVIGTMNTADRSIALLDTALRRRFGFIELMPDYAPLKYAVVAGIPLGLWLEALNRRICEHIGRDARNLQIGHAYLLERSHPISDIATLAHVIQEDILPLLEEYCYEDYTKLGEILGSSLVDVKNQKINHDLFAVSQQDNLIDALLLPYPGLTTSILAVDAEARAAKEQEEEGNNDETSVDGDA